VILFLKQLCEKRILIISEIILFLFLNLHAAEAKLNNQDSLIDNKSISKTIIEDLINAGEDYLQILNYSITSTYKHIAYPLATIDIALIASGLDENIRVCQCKKQDIWLLKQMGEVKTAIALPSGIYLSGLIFKDEELRTTGRLLFESLLLSSTVNTGLKYILGRSRPFMEMGNYNFQFFEFSDNYQSFPSGHTCAAFTIATLLAGRIDNNWVDAGLYLLATGTGFHRILADKHWFSDVIIGGAIGIFSSNLVLSAFEDNEKEKLRNKDKEQNKYTWSIQPQLGFYGSRILFTLKW